MTWVLLCFIFIVVLICGLGERVVLLHAISWVDVHSLHISPAKLQTLKQRITECYGLEGTSVNAEYI